MLHLQTITNPFSSTGPVDTWSSSNLLVFLRDCRVAAISVKALGRFDQRSPNKEPSFPKGNGELVEQISMEFDTLVETRRVDCSWMFHLEVALTCVD